jgi:hypothetical protein
MSIKEAVIESIQELPEEATLEQILEHIAIMAALRKADESIKAGRVSSHDEVKKMVASWIAK